jgi:ankyrin repeat protein
MPASRKLPRPAPQDIDAFVAAAKDGDVATVAAFAKKFGARHLNAKGSKGDTALTRAARFNQLAVVRRLLASGADPDARDSHRGTPLMDAAVGGHVKVIEELLAHGADVTKKSYAHETAEWYARVNKHEAAAKLIADAPRRRAEEAARLTAATAGSVVEGLNKSITVSRPLKLRRRL